MEKKGAHNQRNIHFHNLTLKMDVCTTSASGLCAAMLLGRCVHIGTLLVPGTLAATDVGAYVEHLVAGWAALWGVTLTVGTTAPDLEHAGPRSVRGEIDALDALMSAAADAGDLVAPADALSGVLYACCTDEFCTDGGCTVCNGAGAALVEYFMPAPPAAGRRWYVPIAHPRVSWRG